MRCALKIEKHTPSPFTSSRQNIIMSTNSSDITCCANCGKGEESTGDLKACMACKRVKYCNRDCQIAHRPQHKKVCKKRAAELHDEALFKQPPLLDDCSICFLRVPLKVSDRQYQPCCGQVLCNGCMYAVAVAGESVLCPFCRQLAADTDAAAVARYEKRAVLNDPNSLYALGSLYNTGSLGLTRDANRARDLWEQAGKLGSPNAYGSIAELYAHGEGVERDLKRAKHYWELSAIRGDVYSRHNLAIYEMKLGNITRGIKHFVIAAKSGYEPVLKDITKLREKGLITEKDYKDILLAFNEAAGKMKSEQREEAARWVEEYERNN